MANDGQTVLKSTLVHFQNHKSFWYYIIQQKIVIKVQVNCDKCRSKALQLAAAKTGVTSMAIEGSDKDQLVLIGEDVDSVNLTRSLRKKLRHATILKVEEVKEKGKDKDQEKGEKDKNPGKAEKDKNPGKAEKEKVQGKAEQAGKDEAQKQPDLSHVQLHPWSWGPCPGPHFYEVFCDCDQNRNNYCSIL
ncbi:hypothetical protein CJ030_MR7G001382 [Morella rubra]|uniref:HMA domain-containing protein n=1 Tax=Morella rubra TaxID=262757 RepID=A0A6A1V6M8_9ROSI|nr:hypothetical protein CJ030_MR0G006556 [Morella rubra]KAB1208413.1 hypothetical protein CJ030_MR7G001382 [Morella rubra]